MAPRATNKQTKKYGDKTNNAIYSPNHKLCAVPISVRIQIFYCLPFCLLIIKHDHEIDSWRQMSLMQNERNAKKHISCNFPQLHCASVSSNGPEPNSIHSHWSTNKADGKFTINGIKKCNTPFQKLITICCPLLLWYNFEVLNVLFFLVEHFTT